MKALFILNAAPYGSELIFNGLRLADTLVKRDYNEVRVYLMGDAAVAVKQGQKLPEGFYNIQVMLNKVLRGPHGSVGVCGVCMDARGIQADELIQGTHRGSLEELADWSEWADKVFVF
ncbi:MAG: hypothetical protein A3I83_01385 [Methylotenera sp. RIFCSPLOWO2_02_FULL_45_14]|nr:MAG: hypothetical protein A3I83_01385 [Methylotenera sp. RIFCSPLOWO2_02_FULL_45_14]